MPRNVAPIQSASRAAVGFRTHSGWAAFVALSLDGKQPRILSRGRPELVESFTYKFRQPYHTAEPMSLDKARAFISGAEKEALRLAQGEIRSLQAALKKQGYKLTRFALIRASGKPLPELPKILASHALIHTADGELFREALRHACGSYGLAEFAIKENDLVDTAGRLLGLETEELMLKVTALGKAIGPPWSRDEKFAALAAWLALRSEPE